MHGMHAVVGTTGFTDADLEAFRTEFSGSNCLIAANFAISAVLMMRFAELAAPFFDTAEIIELHHDKKIDAPSGTAVVTAQRMATASDTWAADPTQHEVYPGARGGVGPGGIHLHAVRMRLGHLLDAVSAALPDATQVVVVDEPELGEVADADFPVAPDVAIDLVSGALAMVEGRGITGLHCSRELDWATLVASGSDVIAVPARPSLVASAGYLQQFLDRGGVVAWGAVPTDGPVPTTAERPWRNLSDLWCELVQHGLIYYPTVTREEFFIQKI
jgi:hypothetical protein